MIADRLLPLDPSPLDNIEPDEVIVLPKGRLERRGTAVDWRGQDGRLLVVGVTENYGAMRPTLALLGLLPPYPELLAWCWS
jgi:hypothetical protein